MYHARKTARVSGQAEERRITSLLLRRQFLHELHRSLNPAAQLVVVLNGFGAHQYPGLHWPAGDVELADVRFLECLVAFVWAEPDDQAVLPDAHTQIASQA